MANELPYFRFFVQEFQNSKVSIESYQVQGVYLNICSFYWVNDCNLTLSILLKKFKNCKSVINLLLKNEIIYHEKRHDKIEIEFLKNQYIILNEKRKLRQVAGLKGSIAKAMLKQNDSYKTKTKDNNKDNIREREELVALPIEIIENLVSLEKVILFFSAKNQTSLEAEKFFYYYEAREWKIGRNFIKNWEALAEKWIKNDLKINTNYKKNENATTKQQSAQSEFNKRYGTKFGI